MFLISPTLFKSQRDILSARIQRAMIKLMDTLRGGRKTLMMRNRAIVFTYLSILTYKSESPENFYMHYLHDCVIAWRIIIQLCFRSTTHCGIRNGAASPRTLSSLGGIRWLRDKSTRGFFFFSRTLSIPRAAAHAVPVSREESSSNRRPGEARCRRLRAP